MKWRAFRHSRWTLGAALVAVVGLSVLTAWFIRDVIGGPEADPGGRILRTLRDTGQALPSDAHVLYRYDLEPKWDSCDGRPGTFGWDNVVVQIHFESRGSTEPLSNGPIRLFAGSVGAQTM